MISWFIISDFENMKNIIFRPNKRLFIKAFGRSYLPFPIFKGLLLSRNQLPAYSTFHGMPAKFIAFWDFSYDIGKEMMTRRSHVVTFGKRSSNWKKYESMFSCYWYLSVSWFFILDAFSGPSCLELAISNAYSQLTLTKV